MRRPTSEVFVRRATLLLHGDLALGLFIALPGADLARCRTADAVSAMAGAGAQRALLMNRIRQASRLFEEVAADEFYLSKIGVRPEMRRSGHGRELVQEYIEAGLRGGFHRFSLDVSADRKHAIGMYRSAGFTEVAENTVGTAMRYLRMELKTT